MDIGIGISINAAPFFARLGRLGDAIESADSPEIEQALVDSATTYLEFARARFRDNSKGGGDWPDHAPSTILARSRKANPQRMTTAARLKQRFPILFDSGGIYGSLQVGGVDNILEVSAGAVRFGTASPIAGYHQRGNPRLPQRVVLPPADGDTRQRIAAILKQAVYATVDAIMRTAA